VIRADLVDPERHVLVRLVFVRPLVSRRGRETADRDEKAHRKSGLFTLWFFFMHWFDSEKALTVSVDAAILRKRLGETRITSKTYPF